MKTKSEIARLRIAKLGGSAYMSALAKARHSKLTPEERHAHSMKMLEAKKLSSSSKLNDSVQE